VYDALVVEKKMLEVAIQEWTKMDKLGKAYSDQTQKDVSFIAKIKMNVVEEEK